MRNLNEKPFIKHYNFLVPPAYTSKSGERVLDWIRAQIGISIGKIFH